MIMARKKNTRFFGGIFVLSLIEICQAAPSASLHPAIWNHDDGASGGSMELHDYRDNQGIRPVPKKLEEPVGSDQSEQSSRNFLATNVDIEQTYENPVNPFLSHIEQEWKAKPVRHRYMRKKPIKSQQQQSATVVDSYADDLSKPLPVDPDKSHFVESTEAGEREDRAFGNEEKDLGDLFSVLFSADY